MKAIVHSADTVAAAVSLGRQSVWERDLEQTGVHRTNSADHMTCRQAVGWGWAATRLHRCHRCHHRDACWQDMVIRHRCSAHAGLPSTITPPPCFQMPEAPFRSSLAIASTRCCALVIRNVVTLCKLNCHDRLQNILYAAQVPYAGCMHSVQVRLYGAQETVELAEFSLHSFAVPNSRVTGHHSQHFEFVSVDYRNPAPIYRAVQVCQPPVNAFVAEIRRRQPAALMGLNMHAS